MKTIGLLGGTGWSSTIQYYKIINQLVHKELGGYHSAKVIIKSIDYHDIMTAYGDDPKAIPILLEKELHDLVALSPESIIVCCNSLHKFVDQITTSLDIKVPVFHAVDLTRIFIEQKGFHKVLLLASQFTMNDGFFLKHLTSNDLEVVIPGPKDRQIIHEIHLQLLDNVTDSTMEKQFRDIVQKNEGVQAVILACSEFALALNKNAFDLPIIDPVQLQCQAAVDYSLLL